MRIVDISLPIEPAMPGWPGDPPVTMSPVARIADGAPANVSELRMGTHTGTHIDPPSHLIDGAPGADELALDVLCGDAYVADRVGGELGAIPEGVGRLVIRTGGSGSLTLDDARRIVERDIILVGIDALSIEPAGSDYPVHRMLLSAGVVVLEGLDLSHAEPGRAELICLPLRIVGADGAPARAILRYP